MSPPWSKQLTKFRRITTKLGTVLVGVSGVEPADLEKLQETNKLTTPLTIAVDKDGPKAYKLNKDAAVTDLGLQEGRHPDLQLRLFGYQVGGRQGHGHRQPRPRNALK